MAQTGARGADYRNGLVGVVAVLAAGLLVAAAAGTYRLFSYLAVGLVVGVVGVASIERNASESDLAPYTGLLVGLGVACAAGFTGIWLLWNPSVTSYTYVLGLPRPTLVYFVFLWLLPIGGAFYYALVFPRIGSDEVVDDIMDDAFAAQRERTMPLAPEVAPERLGSDGGAEADGGTGVEAGTVTGRGDSGGTGDDGADASGGEKR